MSARARISAILRRSIPYIGGPLDGKRYGVSLLDAAFGFATETVCVLRFADGRYETCLLDRLNIADPRFDDGGMRWEGNYVVNRGGTAVEWEACPTDAEVEAEIDAMVERRLRHRRRVSSPPTGAANGE